MMSTLDSGSVEPFDFDEWMRLAHKDPDGFERRRLAVIDSYISTLPSAKQRRLRGLQFRIDMERRRARTPMGACIKLSAMMWDALLGEEGLRASLLMLNSSHPRHHRNEATQKPSAQVLAFRKDWQ